MNTSTLKSTIAANAAEIARLHARVHETARSRGTGARELEEWRRACAEFHARYNELAFPGGYDGASARILAGDPLSVEAAICFLEVRPYFFRSGYMYKDLLRKVKRAPLSTEQAGRLQLIVERRVLWRQQRARKDTA
jgi:hypothetical protein